MWISVVVARTTEPLFIAPLYVEYTSSSPEEFATEAEQLKQKVGSSGPNAIVGFSAFLSMQFQKPELDRTIEPEVIQPTLDTIQLMLDNGIVGRVKEIVK